MRLSRRETLLGAVAAVPALGSTPKSAVPQVPFGRGMISRLIVGGNPVSGTSHWSSQMSQEMIDYFTSENVKRLLRNCERAGVNTWQSRGDRHILRILHEYRQEGGQVNWIAQTATEIDYNRNISEISRQKPLGIYYHGVKTDRAFLAGKLNDVRDDLKRIRDTGALVGLGTHIPQAIDFSEEKGFDVDFYMACVYNLSRSEEEKRRLAGGQPPDELFWDPDRQEMLKRVRATSKQCLIFKVYGATRHCDSKARMQAALNLAFEYAKPNDAVVIGMWPKYTEQVVENCEMVCKAIRPVS